MRLFSFVLASVFAIGSASLCAEEVAEPCQRAGCIPKLFEVVKERYPHLKLDLDLCKGSQKWADHLADTGQFKHDRGVKENIARGYRTSLDAVRAWFKSPGHNRQFKNNVRIGFGASERNGRRIWVSRFR